MAADKIKGLAPTPKTAESRKNPPTAKQSLVRYEDPEFLDVGSVKKSRIKSRTLTHMVRVSNPASVRDKTSKKDVSNSSKKNDAVTVLERRLDSVVAALHQAQAIASEQSGQISRLHALARLLAVTHPVAFAGRELALKKMVDVAAKSPNDRYVSFCLANGEYVTGASELDVIDKFEARFGTDQDGWVERIWRGPRDDNPGHGG